MVLHTFNHKLVFHSRVLLVLRVGFRMARKVWQFTGVQPLYSGDRLQFSYTVDLDKSEPCAQATQDADECLPLVTRTSY